MSKLIDIASAEIGVKEIEGSEHNKRILQYAREAGFDWVNSDETPWCSIFLNWATRKAGLKRSKDARSGSWVHVGTPIQNPKPGDIVLFGSNGDINKIYHVGIFMGFSEDGQRVFCLGGNQTNQVSISKSWRGNVAGYRRLEELNDLPIENEPEPISEEVSTPTEDDIPELSKTNPTTTHEDNTVNTTRNDTDERSAVGRLVFKLLEKKKLRRGDKGSKVKELQIGLNKAGFPCGTPDGNFGPKTENAVKRLQKAGGIKVSGIVNRKTRRYLASLLVG